METLRPLQSHHSRLALALAGLLLLSGCGIKGDLETPPPIWGEKASETQPDRPESGS